MSIVPINYWAILVAAVVKIALGALWFGPLFGKQWFALSGMTAADKQAAMKKGMAWSYGITFAGAFVMAYVMAHALVFADSYLGTSGVSSGLMVGFWNWIGFVVPVSLGVVLWGDKSWKYWLVTYSYDLVGMLLMGVVLAWWK